MSEADIVRIKDKLGREVVKISSDVLEDFSINKVCDDILSNYIAYYLYSRREEKSIEHLLDFLKRRGNLDDRILKFVKDYHSIIRLLLEIDFYPLLQDSYTLAKTYESMKSCVVKTSRGEIALNRSLDYRKSRGMFFTPREIVKFIVEKTFENKKKEIEDLIGKGELEGAIRELLELKIVDIACGVGSFLIEVIHVIREIRSEIIHQFGEDSLRRIDCGKLIADEKEFLNYILKNSIFGVDIDKNASLLCAYNALRTTLTDMDGLCIYEKHIRVGDSLTGDLSGRARAIEEKYSDVIRNSIDWPQDFTEVFSRNNPGFDIIIMNPPYGKVRLESHKGYNKNNEIGKEEREKVKKLANYFRESNLYHLSTYGVLNFYKLMIERAFGLLRKGGSLGFIVPNTLLCDKSTSKIRKHLFDNMDAKIIVNIPENSDFFKDVTQSFCIVISSSGISRKMKFKGNVSREIDLKNDDFIDIDINFIREKFPEMLYIPITDRVGFQILNKLHNNKRLINYSYIKNSRGEVDLTKFSRIISSDNRLKRLIRGNNIEKYQINDDVMTKQSFIDEKELKRELSSSPKLIDIAKERLICKQIANQNKRERLEFTLISSNSILANSCNYIALRNSEDPIIMRYLLGFLNSSLVEWRFGVTSTNNHINNYEINDLPLVIPRKGSKEWEILEEIANSAVNLENRVKSNERVHLESKIDWLVFKLFELSIDEIEYIVSEIGKGDRYMQLLRKHINVDRTRSGVYNHKTAPLSDLEMKMVYAIPEGGNWRDIPEDIESERVQQIRKTGGRSTYYGRLRWDRPAYTISTYFSRTGNGCFIHPEQHRLISLREGARLQSFPDWFIFHGTKTSMYHQIGNAVPPLMARALGAVIKPRHFVNLFCGAGGFSLGIEWIGGKCELAIDFDKHCCETFEKNRNLSKDQILNQDIRELDSVSTFSTLNKIDLVIGGPPCQGFSTAGKRILDDPRNELVKYFIKSVEIIAPTYFVMENVKGILHFQKGQIIREIFQEFEDIGYSTQYRVLMAADYGAPQLRERVFFIGNKIKKPITFPRKLFSKEGRDLPNYITVGDAISDLPPLKIGEGTMDKTPYLTAPKSNYQRLMRGELSFGGFYNQEGGKQVSKSYGQTNLHVFH